MGLELLSNDIPKVQMDFKRIILDGVRDNLDPAPGSRNWGSELGDDAKFLTAFF
jgi:hypothetical protein